MGTKASSDGRHAETRLTVRRYGQETDVHTHDHHQVVLPLTGQLEMEIDGHGGCVADHRAAIIVSGERHGFTGTGDNAFLVLDLPDDRSHGKLWDAAAGQPFVQLDAPLNQFCGFLAAEVSRYGEAGLRADPAGELLSGALARRLGVGGPAEHGSLERARWFIRNHFHEDLDVNAVAQAAGLSPSRLHALFRQQLATTPGEFITRQRLNKAARLLRTSNRPIAEIAFSVGYADQSAFTRAFRRTHGETPARYRRRKQEFRHKL